MKHMYQRLLVTLSVLALLLTPVMAADADLVWGDVYCFTEADLAVGEDTAGILITSVPDDSLGTVNLGARVIRAGDVLTTDTLSKLAFLPAENAVGEAAVSCISISHEGLGENAEMTIRIGSGKNTAPTAEDSEFETYKNIPGQIPLKASDPEGDSLTVSIVKEPKRGTVTLNADGTVTYTPAENKVGKDSFVYTVTDPAGNTSEEATVRISIRKPSDKQTYADMEGDPALLCATWLREMSVYSGETVSGNLLFQPEETLSRGEFIAMCVALTAQDAPETVSTGFADESSMPQWLEPYVAEAVKCGYLSGIPTDEGLSLLAQQDITRGEAAVMVSGMLSLPEASTLTVMAAEDAVPAWATASVSAVLEAGLFDATESDMPLTRREAAQLLYDTWHLANENSSDSTLLSWAKE